MSNTTSNTTSIVAVSNDRLFVEEIRLNSPLKGETKHIEFESDSIKAAELIALIEKELGSDHAPVMIIDLDVIVSEQHTILLRNLKSHWARTSLILTGNSEALSRVLQPDVQPLVYRAFNKPVNVRQLSLSLEPAETMFSKAPAPSAQIKVEADSGADSRKSIVFAGFGIAALCIGAWLYFSGSGSDTANLSDNGQDISGTTISESIADPSIPSTEANSQSDLELVIDQGELALREGRLIAPKNDNALFYFNSALKQDPYNNRAYSGRKELANTFLNHYPTLISEGQYQQALAYFDAYKSITPLDRNIDNYYKKAKDQIAKHFAKSRASDDTSQGAKAKREFEEIVDRFDQDSPIATTLANEQTVLKQVRASIGASNLIPPASANAYTMLSEAVAKNSISNVNQERLTKELEAALNSEIKSKLDDAKTAEEVATVNGLIAHLKLVNAKSSNIKTYSNLAQQKQADLDAAKEDEKAQLATKPKIAPAKLLSRKAPKYPQRALDRGLEGWVEVAFKIDTEGRPIDVVVKQSDPSDTFDDAALRSLKDWKFLPAMDMNSGKPVVTELMSTMMHFKLEN